MSEKDTQGTWFVVRKLTTFLGVVSAVMALIAAGISTGVIGYGDGRMAAIDEHSQKLHEQQEEMRRLLEVWGNILDRAETIGSDELSAAAIASQFEDVDSRVSALEATIGSSPRAVIDVALLNQKLSIVQESQREEMQGLRTEIERTYQFFTYSVLALVIAVLAGVLQNFARRKE